MRVEVIVHKSPRGELTGKEIREILDAMKSQGIHAEYTYHTGWLPGDRKDFLTLIPKNQDLDTFLADLKELLRTKLRGKYMAKLSQGTSSRRTVTPI